MWANLRYDMPLCVKIQKTSLCFEYKKLFSRVNNNNNNNNNNNAILLSGVTQNSRSPKKQKCDNAILYIYAKYKVVSIEGCWVLLRVSSLLNALTY